MISLAQLSCCFFSIVWRSKCSTLLVLPLFLHTFCTHAYAQFLVEVLIDNRPMIRCDATGANFGDDVMAFSFGPYAVGCALLAQPKDACKDVEPPPLINATACLSNFALVPRGNCTFSEKAYYAQKQYNGLIMYNERGHSPIPMAGSKFSDNVTIPVVMVSYACMESLVDHYSAANGYVVTLKASPGYYDLIKYLVPFVVIVGFCFVVLFISLIIRLWKERRRLAKKRLSRSNLKKIPTKRFAKGDREETCAICLEDFVEGDKLRVLACKHAYHCKCIDPWLTKNRKVCPVCKRRVGPSSNDSSDSDSERASTSTLPPTRENEPLIGNEQPMAISSSAEFPYPPTSLSSMPVVQMSRIESLRNFLRRFREPRFNNAANESRVGALSSTSSLEVNHHSRELLVPDRLMERQPTRLSQIRESFAYNWSQMMRRAHADSLPHSRLENEEVSTASIDDDELGFGRSSTVTSELSSQSSFQIAPGTDTNSLTTMDSTSANFNADGVNTTNDSQAR